MSHEVAVSAENVSKRFVLHRNRAGDLRELFTGLLRKGNKSAGAADNAFYALRDVGFSIQRGETVGIVGHNGSGKSTLLKMLTGILKPDTGHIQTHGRIGALIEVGAGFHPDLSGRENIFLNGSIMGLSRRELEGKFDEIVSFAGLERFIDTPVKRYSSGMYMRLGFAIATHIEPEILLIDEVLAVGDTQFQNKCVKHLRDFASNGGTVVFVSHAMGQVAGLCERCLWLDRGQLLHDGPTTDAIDKYMAVVAEREDEELKRSHPEEWEAREAEKIRAEQQLLQDEAAARLAQEEVARQEAEIRAQYESTRPWRRPGRSRIISAVICDEFGRTRNQLKTGEPFYVEITYQLNQPMPEMSIRFDIYRVVDELHMFAANSANTPMIASGDSLKGKVRCYVPFCSLGDGEYRLNCSLYAEVHWEEWNAGLWEAGIEDLVIEAFTFEVRSSNPDGVVFMPTSWKTTDVITSKESSNINHSPLENKKNPLVTA